LSKILACAAWCVFKLSRDRSKGLISVILHIRSAIEQQKLELFSATLGQNTVFSYQKRQFSQVTEAAQAAFVVENP